MYSEYGEIRRGDIFYIDIPYSTGHEMEKDRPGIVVGNDHLNNNCPVVTVVMCSASDRREMPEHITVRSTPVPSTALCEHIYTVDRSRIGKKVGHCTPSEMAAVDVALMSGLGLGAYDLARGNVDVLEVEGHCDSGDTESQLLSLAKIEAERDTYKALYEGLLARMVEAATG